MSFLRPLLLFVSFAGISLISSLAATFGGPTATPYIAFVGIGCAMLLKDCAQEQHGSLFALGLILGGAYATLLIPQTKHIALAGVVAFIVSGVADVMVLRWTRSKPLSDAVSAILDTVIFLTLAFGDGPFLLQFTMKFWGAQFWRAAFPPRIHLGTGVSRFGPFVLQIITVSGQEYMRRYELDLLWLRVCVHRFSTADPDTALHNHPWNAVFFVLRGGYSEETLAGMEEVRWVNFVARSTFHRVAGLARTPTWTLGILFGQPASWGFYTEGKYVAWQTYLRYSR